MTDIPPTPEGWEAMWVWVESQARWFPTVLDPEGRSHWTEPSPFKRNEKVIAMPRDDTDPTPPAPPNEEDLAAFEKMKKMGPGVTSAPHTEAQVALHNARVAISSAEDELEAFESAKWKSEVMDALALADKIIRGAFDKAGEA